jgi:hypothetical protein
MSEVTEITSAEVRAWAIENGHPELAGKSGRIGAEIYAEHAAATSPGPAAPSPAAGPDPDPLTVEPPGSGDDAERRPEAPAGRVAGKLRGLRGGRAAGKPAKPAKAAAGKGRGRVSIEKIAAMGWVGAVRLVAMTGPQYMPVGKMMMFQAPVAGAVIEQQLKGTVADRVLQPIARLAENGGALGGLLGPPLLTAAVCRYPALYPQVRPVLAAAMREWVIVAGPQLRAMRVKEEKFQREMAAFDDEYGVSLDDLLDSVFSELLAAMAAQQFGGPGDPGTNGQGAAGHEYGPQ